MIDRSRTKTIRLTDDVLEFLEADVGSELVFSKGIGKHGKYCLLFNEERTPITEVDL